MIWKDEYSGGYHITSKNKVECSPYKEDIKKYLCEGYSPNEICKWIKSLTNDKQQWISPATILRYKQKYCPNVKTDKNKKLISESKNQRNSPSKKTNQTNFTIIDENQKYTYDELHQLSIRIGIKMGNRIENKIDNNEELSEKETRLFATCLKQNTPDDSGPEVENLSDLINENTKAMLNDRAKWCS